MPLEESENCPPYAKRRRRSRVDRAIYLAKNHDSYAKQQKTYQEHEAVLAAFDILNDQVHTAI